MSLVLEGRFLTTGPLGKSFDAVLNYACPFLISSVWLLLSPKPQPPQQTPLLWGAYLCPPLLSLLVAALA